MTTATPFFSDQTLRFSVLGLASGALIALVALGVVLVHRSSGVINFAASAFGAVGAFLFYDLRDQHGWSTWPALAVALVLGIALGALTHFAIRFMGAASILAKLIATLGMMAAAQGAIVVFLGDDKGTPKSILPTSVVRITHSIPISKDRLIIIALVAVLAVVLGLVYTKTLFGLATSAVSENRRVASTSGWSPATIELINFTLAGLLSTVAAILVAPIVTLQSTALALLVIPALAAALVGKFSSFPLTVLGAAIIGIGQSLTSLFQNDIANGLNVDPSSLAGLPQVVPLIIILGLLVARGSSRPRRSEDSLRLPLPGSGRINLPLLALAIGGTLALVYSLNASWSDAITLTLSGAVLILSIVVITGYAGQLSLAQFALAGLGCWIAARLDSAGHWPFGWAMIGGILLTVPIGMVVAIPAMRTRGVNLAVATLGLALVIEAMVFSNGSLTGGFFGTVVTPPNILGINIDPISKPHAYAVFALILTVLTGLMVANVRRGDSGRRLLAIRGNERAAAALGVGIYRTKLFAFGLASAIAAVSGIIYGFRNENIQFTEFDVSGSIGAILNAVIGGLGWAAGTPVGAQLQPNALGSKVWQTILPHVTQLDAWLMMVSGVFAVLTLRTAPDGIAALHAHQMDWVRQKLHRQRSMDLPVQTNRAEPKPPAELTMREVTVAFGGVRALTDVSFDVHPGEVVGLMGPNGAGKTTMLDVITGFTPPDHGQVMLNGSAVDRRSPERRARDGVGRSWQSVELFEEMTILDNLLVALDDQSVSRYFLDVAHPRKPALSELAKLVIDDFDLQDKLQLRPSALSQGDGRLVGIARAILAEPSVLLLDEPAAGLDVHESAELGTAIRKIVTTRGIGVLLVEHDIEMLTAICDRIVVLDFGRVIATGTPTEVMRHPEVIRAYLGEETLPDGEGATGRQIAAEPALDVSVLTVEPARGPA